jgi:3-oxoacyl-[acyl-carrier protein] reductase
LTSEFVAVVTGGGAGIGRAISIAVAGAGRATAVVDLNERTALQTVDMIHAQGGTAVAYAADVTDENDAARVIKLIETELGPIGYLVNNAGGVPVDRDGMNRVREEAASPGEGTLLTEDIPVSEWRLMVDLNLTSQFLMTRTVLARMRERRFGRIVCISSTAARSIGSAAGVHYTAAKAGVIAFARHVASEVAQFGVTVNVVCPGPVLTTKIEGSIGSLADDREAEIPIGRWLEPPELGRAVAFLLAPESGGITGAVLDVDGGILLGRADMPFVNAIRRVAWGERIATNAGSGAVRDGA